MVVMTSASTTISSSSALELDVLASASGDREAFGRVVEATKSMVSSIALALIGDPDVSQDIAQDVFLAAWKGLGQLRNPASFKPWLRQTTRYRSRTWLRDHGRRRAAFGEADDELLAQAVDSRPSASDEMASLEQRRLLSEALEELPVETREIVVLFYREGRSVAQVSALLELSPDAVKKRLSRARRRLRDDVARQFERTVVETALPAAFNVTVLSALTASAPAAATVTVGVAAKSVSTSLFAKLATGFGGLGLWLGVNLLGVTFDLRPHFLEARGDQKRLRLLRLFRLSAMVLVTVLYVHVAAAYWWRQPILMVVGAVVWLVGYGVLYGIVLPRLSPEYFLRMYPNVVVNRLINLLRLVVVIVALDGILMFYNKGLLF